MFQGILAQSIFSMAVIMKLMPWKLPLKKVFHVNLDQLDSKYNEYNATGIWGCIFEHSLCVFCLPDEALQPVVKPLIVPISRLGSVGGSGTECLAQGEICNAETPPCCFGGCGGIGINRCVLNPHTNSPPIEKLKWPITVERWAALPFIFINRFFCKECSIFLFDI